MVLLAIEFSPPYFQAYLRIVYTYPYAYTRNYIYA